MKVRFLHNLFICDSSYEERHLPKSAGFRWHGGSCWVPEKCPACKAGLGKLWWTDDSTKALKLAEYFDDSAKEATVDCVASIEKSRSISSDRDLQSPDNLSYLPYQRAGIDFALGRENTLIADEMGLGKTIQALGVINNDSSIKSVLIICPASLRLNWQKEAKKWLVRNFTIQVCKSKLDPKADLVICNYEKIKGNLEKELKSRKWDLIIIDEAHYLKNPKTKRSKSILGVRPTWKKEGGQWIEKTPRVPGVVDSCKKRIYLTGTPILNKPIELYPLISSLDPQTWRSRSYYAKHFCDAGYNGYGWDESGARNLDELQDKLRSTIMVRRLKADVLKDLPSKRRQIIVCESKKSDLLSEKEIFEATGKSYQDVVADLEKGFVGSFEELSNLRHSIAKAKLPYVIDHIQSMIDSGVNKIVVFAHHHDVVDSIYSQFSNIAVKLDGRMSENKKDASVNFFQNDSNIKIFIGSIKAAGVGLTLTASSNVVFAELDWVPANLVQAEDRCHRIGQQDSVLIQHIVLDGSLDQRICQLIVKKQNVADKALDIETKVDLSSAKEKVKKDQEKSKKQSKEKIKVTEKEAISYTQEQKDCVLACLRVLAANCDGARTEDGQGFNKLDTNFGKSLATSVELTDKQMRYAVKLVRKYQRQLDKDVVEIVLGKSSKKKVKETIRKKGNNKKVEKSIVKNKKKAKMNKDETHWQF